VYVAADAVGVAAMMKNITSEAPSHALSSREIITASLSRANTTNAFSPYGEPRKAAPRPFITLPRSILGKPTHPVVDKLLALRRLKEGKTPLQSTISKEPLQTYIFL
jgi:hypothetical protein